MAKYSLLLADDLSERSTQGRLRSRLLRLNAIELAKKFKSDIELLYVKDLTPGFLKKNDLKSLEDAFEDIAASAVSQFKKAFIKGKIEIRSGLPAEEILKYTELSDKVNMMLLGTHGKKGVTKLLLGSVAEEVLRHAKIPVMVLGPAAQEKESLLKLDEDTKILLLTDLSSSSQAAEKFALSLSQKFGSTVTAVHCLGDQIMKTRATLYGSGYVPFDMDKMFNEMIADAQKDMEKKINSWKKEGLSVQPLVTTKEEPIEKTFLSEVRKGYDLVVMGTHGRNRVLSAFLGSAARKALLTSPVPVVVVRGQ